MDGVAPQETVAATPPAAIWESYRAFVQRHAALIDLVDSAASQLLFLTPQEKQNRWREVVYGLMSLNRMAVDMAQQDHILNSFGTSITVRPDSIVPATSLRVLLNVTHSLLPSLLEWTKHSSDMRLFLERVKFLLRLSLLSAYWYHLWKERQMDAAGLLLRGGIYDSHEQEGPSVEDHQSHCRRWRYVGKRTGRRVVSQPTRNSKQQSLQNGSFLSLMLGELLYICRPLYWARMEQQQYRPTLRQWISSLGMDMVSLVLLRQHQKNRVGRDEVRRRKMKLFLYLLRSPIWERYTQRGVERISNGMERTPLLGRLIATYLWDWLLYYKHPFVSEQG